MTVWLDFGSLIYPLSATLRKNKAVDKNPAIADGVVCVRFYREMDSDT